MATKNFHSVNSLVLAKRVVCNMCFSFIVIDDATKEVVYRDYIDISVAVATPRVCWGKNWECLLRSWLSYFSIAMIMARPRQLRKERVHWVGFSFRGVRVHCHHDRECGSRHAAGAVAESAAC